MPCAVANFSQDMGGGIRYSWAPKAPNFQSHPLLAVVRPAPSPKRQNGKRISRARDINIIYIIVASVFFILCSSSIGSLNALFLARDASFPGQNIPFPGLVPVHVTACLATT